MRRRVIPAVLVLACCGCAARADVPKAGQSPAPARTVDLFDPARHMRTSEVRPGMKGYGLSVFSGTRLERFDVEVISVLKNQMGPQQDVVLIRCKGQGLEHSGAVAGMSGSPIWLTDDQGHERMIGAFALGWQFSKDPIAGVRPIEEMLRVPTVLREPAVAGKAAQASTWDARPMMRSLAGGGKPNAAASAASDDGRTLTPLALPLTVSGVPQSFIDTLQPLLRQSRLTLLQSGGAGDAPAGNEQAKLEPGSAIGIPVVSGDLDMSAIGTVTEVLGDRVFAFGHEFNAEGAVDLPMGVGYIHTIIPNASMSFKLGSLIRTDGAIYSDEVTAIAGTIGKAPATIPIEITVTSPQRAEPVTYRYQVARHPRFTPFGTISAIAAAIMGHSQLPAEFTINYELNMEFDGGRSVVMRNQTTSLMQAMELIRDLQTPVMFAIDNPFARVYPSKITGKVSVGTSIEADMLRGVTTDKKAYKPGETVRLFVTTRPWRGKDVQQTYDFKLPSDLPEGPAVLTIGDAQRYTMDEMRFSPYRFHADSVDDVFSLIQSITADSSRQLYIRLTTPGEGVSVGRAALPRMPGGKRQILTHTPSADVSAYPESVVVKHDLPRSLVGSADVMLVVSRHPEKAQMMPPAPAPGVPPQAGPQPGQEAPHTPDSPHQE